MRFVILFAFFLTIPAANWLIGNFGSVCVPKGPCLIPVWPGVLAPSGVLMIGADDAQAKLFPETSIEEACECYDGDTV